MRLPDRVDSAGMSPARFPTLIHVWIAALFAAILLRTFLMPVPPNDLWWQLAMGRLIVETGGIPTHDVFSFTQAGRQYYDQPWLAQLLMYGLHRVGGVPLLLVVQAALVSLAYAILLRLCVLRTGAAKLSVGLLLLTMPVTATSWTPRSQMFALPLFIGFLFILSDWRLGLRRAASATGGDALWLLPPLMVLWVNLHGSFVLGGVLVALTFAGVWLERYPAARNLAALDLAAPDLAADDPGTRNGLRSGPAPSLRPLVLWGALTAAAILLNPRGIGVLGYVANLTLDPTIRSIVTEWERPTIASLDGKVFFAFTTVLALALAFARRRPDPVDVLLAVAFFWLALSGRRHAVWFGLAAAPLLVVQVASLVRPRAASLARPRDRSLGGGQGKRTLNIAFLSAFALLTFAVLPWLKPRLALPPGLRNVISASTPVNAVRFLRQDPSPPARVFQSEGYGSYLMWAAPERTVFIDTRIELYPVEQWLDYQRLGAGLLLDTLVRRYDLDGLLIDNKRQARLLAVIGRRPEWEVRYTDDHTTYAVRRGEPEEPTGG